MVLRFFILAMAIAFLFISCADGERDNPQDPGSGNYRPPSSSSKPSSSSAAELKNYCVYSELQQCYFGIYSACPGVGGVLADECPYSSSSAVPSSSSGQSRQSSSSAREYDYCVFVSEGICLTGPLSECPPGGTLSNSCPYGGSSSSLPSSSSIITYTLACASVPTSGTAGSAISAPTVTCNGTTVSSGLSWTGAPAWANPAAGTYSSISVSASSGNCSGKTATCSGTLTVQSLAVYGTPVTYEGETYQTVVIGTQTWMARNLNYAVEGSKCGDGSSLSDANTATCDTYGRLYDWATAMDLPSSCNSSSCSGQVNSKHRGICPSGWHIPSNAEQTTLTNFVGSSTAGTKLRAASGWDDTNGKSGNGTDIYGFKALPGSNSSYGNFYGTGLSGSWWSATESSGADYAFYWGVNSGYEKVSCGGVPKDFLHSVRCLQD